MLDISADAIYEIQHSSIIFCEQIFNLTPQPLKTEYAARFRMGLLLRDRAWSDFCASVRPYWFEDYQEGVHLTWQQTLVLYGVDKSLRHEVSNRISIASGHGIGKSAILSILILWFLVSHSDSQVACTAPSADQMYDVLWKELKKWLDRMPKPFAAQYQWESSHIRMKEGLQTWFARAKTSSKENTEALAGIHADWVFLAADEASGIEEPIFETMEGALTSGNTLVFLISNPTRSLGYFYDTHHKDKARWQTYTFSSLESPRVDQKYIDNIVAKYGTDSMQYAIRVEGRFPDEGIMDDKGYVQLFNDSDLHIVPYDNDWMPIGRPRAALDASGEGQDKTEWALRDRARGGIVAEEDVSTAATMANKSITIVDKYRIDPIDFVIDAFGKGHPVAQEIALATAKEQRPWRVTPVNIGEPCDDARDAEMFVNIRAMIYWRFMLWCRAGGELMDSPMLREQLRSIRFKRTVNGRIQIMDKVSMKKLGFPSPDKTDALSMTFLRPDVMEARTGNGYPVVPNAAPFDPNITMS